MQMKEALLRALKQHNTTPAQFFQHCKRNAPKPAPIVKRSKPS